MDVGEMVFGSKGQRIYEIAKEIVALPYERGYGLKRMQLMIKGLQIIDPYMSFNEARISARYCIVRKKTTFPRRFYKYINEDGGLKQ